MANKTYKNKLRDRDMAKQAKSRFYLADLRLNRTLIDKMQWGNSMEKKHAQN